jgi:hypothetical protein
MNTNDKCIVIWGNKDILSASIRNFLGVHEGWEVINISSLDELDHLIVKRNRTCPAIVVIVYQEKQFCLSKLHLHLLQDHAKIKLVLISLEHNMMEIYDKQNILIQQASDLFSVIKTEA